MHAAKPGDLMKRLICANLAAYYKNQSFSCTTLTVINLPGTPLVVHPFQRHIRNANVLTS